jgi:hypothetical protein
VTAVPEFIEGIEGIGRRNKPSETVPAITEPVEVVEGTSQFIINNSQFKLT